MSRLRWSSAEPLRQLVVALLGATLVLPNIGCNVEPEIRRYSVARKPKTEIAQEQRTLGAIIPGKGTAWIFKMIGAPNSVLPHVDLFKAWVETVEFDASGKAKWKLPESWREGPGTEIVYATIFPGGEAAPRTTVTQLPVGQEQGITEEYWRDYVTRNVNRWRGELQLPSQDWAAIASELVTLEKQSQSSAKAYFVSLEGSSSKPLMSPSMQPGAAKLGQAPTASPKLDYQIPKGWIVSKQPSTMRLASFSIEQDGDSADVSIIPASGDERDNVARWQRQLVPEASEERVNKVINAAEVVTVNEIQSKVFFLTNDSAENKEAILAAIIPWQSSSSLFVKLSGSAAIAQTNRQQFFELLATLKW